jgi:hypothetical protein
MLALAIAEGAVRLYFAVAPAPASSSYVADLDTGYRLRPGPFWEDGRDPADVINSLGFRDRERPREKPPGTFRIVGIGDSFVLGAVPPERNFLRLLEQMWNDSIAAASPARARDTSPGRPAGSEPATAAPIDAVLSGPARAEVMLMGLGGYSPENEIGVLRAAALPAGPDLVVLCFYVGNDVTGIGLRGEVLGGELYFVDSPNRLHGLLRRSRLFVVLEKGIVTRWRHANIQRQRERGAVTGEGAPEPEAGPTLYYKLIVKKRLPVYARAADRGTERLWTRSEAAIAEFDRLCREADVPWILLLIPGEEQVDAQVRTKLLEAIGADSADYDFDLPQRRLTAFARSRGVRTLDLLPDFRARTASGERLYIPNDTHWNATGNGRAAEALLRAAFPEGIARGVSPAP